MKFKTIIFGSGYHGRLALRKLKEKKSKFNPIFFLDNEKKKHYRTCIEKKIFPVEKIKKVDFDKIALCGRNIESQIYQLRKYKIPAKKYLFLGKSEIKPNKKDFLQRSRLLFKILEYVINKFNNENIEYWVDYSGLLSLLRNDDLAELSDVEISINIKDIIKVEKILSKKNNVFKSYYILKKNKKYVKVKKKKFKRIVLFSNTKSKKFEIPNVDFVIKDLLKYKAKNLYLETSTPIKFWRKEKTIVYNGLSLRVPNFTMEYIRLLYGKGWRQSVEFWGSTKNGFKEVKKSFYYGLLKN